MSAEYDQLVATYRATLTGQAEARSVAEHADNCLHVASVAVINAKNALDAWVAADVRSGLEPTAERVEGT